MGLPVSKNPLLTKWSTIFNILRDKTEIGEEEIQQMLDSTGFTVTALYEMLGAENYQRYMERGVIEIAPLAYMRGRTLDDSFIILDEAQNSTTSQMRMFLTRLGFKSKMIITGDITQIDLHRNVISGLKEAESILGKIKSIDFVKLNADRLEKFRTITTIKSDGFVYVFQVSYIL